MKKVGFLLAGLHLATATPQGMESMTMDPPAVSTETGDTPSPSAPAPGGDFFEPDLDPSGEPFTPGATITKIKYGPYSVDAMDMVENRPALNIDKPCSDCYIVALQAGLEYPNGTAANIDTGAWLHHMVLYVNGIGLVDPVCAIGPYRVYASGNERGCARTNRHLNYGIHVPQLGSIGMLYDLMNDSEDQQDYIITMTYEWVDGAAAEDYKPVTVAWLDVTGNCPISYVPPQEGQFEVKSSGWRSTVSGRLLSAYGHEHDGGVDTTIYKNGEVVCVSNMKYGGDPAYVSGGGMSDMPGMGGDAVEHLSAASVCQDFGDVSVGDTLVIGAHYDTDAHPLDVDMETGEPMEIMGISRVYIGT